MSQNNSFLYNVKLISGRSNVELAKSTSKFLGIPLEECIIEDFANTEINVKLTDTIRGSDIFVISSGCALDGRSINDHLIESLLLCDACRRSNAKSITFITTSFPYARADKKDHRGPISSKLVIDLIVASGANRIISVDLHSGQIQGFADIPFDNLYSINNMIYHFKNGIFKDKTNEELNKEYILVSPDAGGIKRIESYAKKLGIDFIILHKQRNYSQKNTVDKSILVGEHHLLKDKIAIVGDDMIDTCGTMVKGIEVLMEKGARGVILFATHGIFSGPALERIMKTDAILKVIVTNSLPQQENIKKCPKIECIDMGPFIGDVIKRLTTGLSVSELFS